MTRETQFIGLTAAAESFVADLEKLPSDISIKGMFDEDIPLRRWAMHPTFEAVVRDRPSACIREAPQLKPWSGGLMLFTCLEFDWGNGAKSIECLGWTLDPSLSRDFRQAEADEGVIVSHGSYYDQDRGTVWA